MKIDARKLKRRVFGFLSFSTALFVFQACYGTPQDFMDTMHIEGKVFSARTAEPVAGIKVSVPESDQHTMTGNYGIFHLMPHINGNYPLRFEDTDPDADGSFAGRDTVIVTSEGYAYVEISLEEE